MPTYTQTGQIVSQKATMTSQATTGMTTIWGSYEDDANHSYTFGASFPFPFYGTVLSSIYVGSNSYLTTTATNEYTISQTTAKGIFIAARDNHYNWTGYIKDPKNKYVTFHFEGGNSASSGNTTTLWWDVTLFVDGTIQLVTHDTQFTPGTGAQSFITNQVADSTALSFTPTAGHTYLFIPKSDFSGYTMMTDSSYVIDSGINIQSTSSVNATLSKAVSLPTNGLLVYLNYKNGLTSTRWNNLAPSDTTGQYNGVINGTLTANSTGITFNGSGGGYVTLSSPTIPIKTGGTGVTYEFWLSVSSSLAAVNAYAMTTSNGTQSKLVTLKDNNTTAGSHYVAMESEGSASNGISKYQGFKPTDTLHHVVVKLETDGNWKLWIDGAFWSSNISVLTNDISGTITLGGDATNGWWNGQISVFRVYNRPLTDTEIGDNYLLATDVGLQVPNAPTDSGAIAIQSQSSINIIPTAIVSPTVIYAYSSVSANPTIVTLSGSIGISSVSSVSSSLNKNVALVTKQLQAYYHINNGQSTNTWANIAPETAGFYDLTLYGDTASRQPGKLHFNGVDVQAQIPANPTKSFDTTNGFTAEVWFKPDTPITEGQVLMGWNYTNSGEFFEVKIHFDGSLEFSNSGSTKGTLANWYSGNGYVQVVVRNDLANNKFEYLLNTSSVYQDANPVSVNPAYPFNDIWLGGASFYHFFKGSIRSVRYYNRPLLDSEIQQLYDLDADVGIDTIQIKTADPFQFNGQLIVNATAQGGSPVQVLQGTVTIAAQSTGQSQGTMNPTGTSNISAQSTLTVTGSVTVAQTSSSSMSAQSSINVTGIIMTAGVNKADLTAISSFSVTGSVRSLFITGSADLSSVSSITSNGNVFYSASVTLGGFSTLRVSTSKGLIGVVHLAGEIEKTVSLVGEM